MKAVASDDDLILLSSDMDVTTKSVRYNVSMSVSQKTRVYSFGCKTPVAAWYCGLFTHKHDVWVTLDETD